jgi:hypothetical protein
LRILREAVKNLPKTTARKRNAPRKGRVILLRDECVATKVRGEDRMSMFRRILFLCLMAAMTATAFAQAKPVVVVELFTSEGCSSCPPADALFRELETRGVAAADLVLLGEHVDYWNNLGWRDGFSSSQFTRRQQDYTAMLRIPDAYTPQAVVDGHTELVGNDEKALRTAIDTAAKSPKPLKVSLNWDNAAQTAHVTVEGNATGELFVAITEDGLSSSVKAGENNGKTLAHAAITRKMIDVGPAKNGVSKEVKVALDEKWNVANLRVIAFVQNMKSGAILGAATTKLR